MSNPRATPVFGPELHGEVQGQAWAHWDVWFCLVTVLDHDGDLRALEQVLVAELKPGNTARSTFEAKLSHVQDLQDRLVAARLTPSDLVTADLQADKALVTKARRKLRDRHLEGRAKTPAMHETPNVRVTRLARYGRWPTFPSDPAPFYAAWAPTSTNASKCGPRASRASSSTALARTYSGGGTDLIASISRRYGQERQAATRPPRERAPDR